MPSDDLTLYRIAPWMYPASAYYPVRPDGRRVPLGYTELIHFPDRVQCPKCRWSGYHFARGFEVRPASLVCMRCLYRWTPQVTGQPTEWASDPERETHFAKRLIAQLDLDAPPFMPVEVREGAPLFDDEPEALAPVARLAARVLSRLEPMPGGPAMAAHIGEAIQVAYLDLAPELHPPGGLTMEMSPAEQYVISLVWMGVALCHSHVDDLGGAVAQSEAVLGALKSTAG